MNIPALVVRLVVVASLVLLAGTAGATSVKNYPEFPARKDSLGSILLLVESAVLVDVDGDVKVVELGTSRALAEHALRQFRDGLAAKGYAVDRALVASLGGQLTDTPTYELRRSTAVRAPGDSAELARAPFELDSALAGRPAVSAAWGSLARRMLGYERKAKHTPDYVPEPIQLGDSLGARVIGAVVIRGWNVPTGKKFRQAFLSGLLSAGTVVMTKTSQTSLEFALLDARSGEILWSEYAYAQGQVGESAITRFAASAMKGLP